MSDSVIVCPSCGEEVPADAKFCEACGHDLNTEPLPACVSCGEREVAEEGYCLSCGYKQPEERDHLTVEAGAAVAVTDRGKRHRHNEDAIAVAELDGGGAVLVVCDGVSSTSGSAEASLRAAAAARDLLVVGLNPGDDAMASGDDAVVTDAEELLIRAVEEAQLQAAASAEVRDGDAGGDALGAAAAPSGLGSGSGAGTGPSAAAGGSAGPGVGNGAGVSAGSGAGGSAGTGFGTGGGSEGGSPSSTFVAVVARPHEDGVALTTAWVGDSRAYWVGERAEQLTGADHELGGSLVRWLGADTINATPDVVSTVVPSGGHVVVCSDGLWRYAPEAEELSELTGRLLSDGHRGLDLASALVAFANEQGGHDNISVALWTDTPDQPAEAGPADQPTDQPTDHEDGEPGS